MSGKISSVAVIGRDFDAWSVAAAVRRSLGDDGVAVRVIELPSLLRPPDACSSVPPIRGLHKQLGLREEVAVLAAKAVPLVAQRFVGWGGNDSMLLGYDQPPPPGSDVGFVQYWAKAKLEGLQSDFSDFSLAACAAKSGRVPLEPQSAPDAPAASYGFNFDARAYADLFKHYALHLGVEAKQSTIAAVAIEDDRIIAVELDDGERVEADLFIDASGAEGALIGRFEDDEFQSWADYLPCDRLLVASAPPASPAPTFAQISAFAAGWMGFYALQDRTAVVAAFSSRHANEQQVAGEMARMARTNLVDHVASRLAPGMRKRSWIGNCVAVGESAASLDHLDSVRLHLTHSCISHLIAIFPVDCASYPEAIVYNRSVRRLAESLRDFQCAHYRLNRRTGESFWDECRAISVPKPLDRRIGLFEKRAQIPVLEDESFQEHDWAALLVGHGIFPESYDPRIDIVADADHVGRVEGRLRMIAEAVPAMPDVAAFLETARARAAQPAP